MTMSQEYVLSYTAEQIDEKLGKVDTALLFAKQTLTEGQKTQARNNIGVPSKTDVEDATSIAVVNFKNDYVDKLPTVHYHTQSLTPEQQAQARANIGASGIYIGSGDMPDYCDVQIDPDGEPVTMEDLVADVIASLPIYNGEVEGV